jgi:CHAT domain-containing protein
VQRLRFQWSKLQLGAGYADRHGARLLENARSLLQTLYQILFAPLESLLPGARLTVVPHGLLHAIPFHALYDGTTYALDRWEIAYAPSAAVWQACRRRGEPEATSSLVYGIGDPGIACVREEVAALRGVVADATIFEDEAATLAAVPSEGAYCYLHFATHARFRQDNPLFSGLRLSDGWLVAADLHRRHLECSLATLSACRTGVSARAPGDEAIGLTRGFLHAGARAVMVSLWSAHDAATAALMRACYAGLSAGKSRAAALQGAQQAVRALYAHPYYWAPFILIGAR